MSKQVDERVVSMQFDNAQFERNVSTTMSTLGKLKESLMFKDSTKGFSEIDRAAKKVDMTHIEKGCEMSAKSFSVLQGAAAVALGNITTTAINAGARIVKALAIEPITTGFQEYETQINAIQTILANTESKGSTLQDVNNALAELNTYADMTIYNFTEMTRNIGTFTAAGIDLDTSVSAIKGIANLAAVSGSTSQQASTAMYQLSQALASGTVKLMDWNSVVNAGMGGQVFQDSLKETARVHGVAIDDMIKKEGSFRETLQKGWLTSEILTETLSKFTGDLSEEQLKSMGYTEEQIAGIIRMGQTANDAATKVKTFTQLFDTLKEAAQSGWTKTWEIIVGDFGEAKELLTEISDTVSGVIGASSDARNELLSGALSTGWKQLLDQGINDAAGFEEMFKSVSKEKGVDLDSIIKMESIAQFTQGLNEMSDAELKLSGHTREQVDKLNELNKGVQEGRISLEDYAKACEEQGATLNSMLTDDIGFQDALKKAFDEGKLGADTISESVSKFTEKVNGMSAAELTAAGYTKAQVIELNELNEKFKDGTLSAEEFVNKITRPSGRELLIESLRNSVAGLMSVIKPIGEAFQEIFPAATADQLYSLIERFRDFTATLKLNDEQATKLKSTFKGIFAAIDIVVTVIKEVVSGAVSLIGRLTGLGNGVLGVTGSFGEMISALRDTIKESGVISTIFGTITKVLQKFMDVLTPSVGGIFGFFQGLFDGIVKFGSKIIEVVSNIASAIGGAFRSGDIGEGLDILNSGILAGVLLGVKKFMKSLTGAVEDGGFLKNITGILDSVRGALEAWQQSLKADTLKKLATAIAILAGSLFVLSMIEPGKLTASLGAITVLFGDLMGSMAIMNKIGEFSFDGVTKAITAMIGISVAVLILASALKKIGDLSLDQLGKGLIGVVALTTTLVIVAKKLSTDGSTVIKGAGQILVMAIALNAMASALRIVAGLNPTELEIGLGGLLVMLAALTYVAKKLSTDGSTVIKGAGQMLLMAIALTTLAGALKIIATMGWEELVGGLTGIVVTLGVMVGAFLLLDKVKQSMFESSAAILIMATAINILVVPLMLLGSMSWESIIKGLVTIAGAIAILGVSAAILSGSGLAVAMLGVAGAVALLGVGCLAAGAGLVLIAAGITALAAAVAGGTTAIVAGLSAIVLGLVNLVGDVIVGICTAIVNSAGALVNALVELIRIAIKALVVCIPELAAVLGQILVGVFGALAEYAPQIVDAFFQFLIGVLQAVASRLPELIQAGVDVLKAFFTGVIDAMGTIDPEMFGKFILAAGQMAILMAALAGVAALTPAAMVGVLGMGAVIAELAIVLAALGGLAQIPGLTWLIGEGAGLMQAVGNAIGNFVGGIVGGIAEGITSALPQIGTDLSTFMDNLQPFIAGASAIDPAMLEGIKSITGVVLALTGANILDGIAKFLGQDAALTKFGDQLAIFGPKLAEFAGSVANINQGTITAASNATKTLAEALAAIPFDWNHNEMTKFGEQLVAFGPDLAEFDGSVAGISTETITSAANATTTLAGALSSIPNDWGHNELTKFGEQLVAFGPDLAEFSSKVAGISSEAITKAVDAIRTIANVQLPDSAKIQGVSDSINNFIDTLNNITSVSESGITSFKTVLSELGTVSIDGFIENFTGASESAKTAVSNFITALSTQATNDNVIMRASFYVLGYWTAKGLAEGINANMHLAINAAVSMANAVKTATNEALKVNSPSKVFMKSGASVVEGFAKGISDNVGDANKAAVGMGKSILGATQDYLKINSPSLVFKDEVGRYIVQGIADGIRDETDAEKAAAEKAQKIVNVIKEVFEEAIRDITHDININDVEYDIWETYEGRNASESEKNEQQLATKYANKAKYAEATNLAMSRYYDLLEHQSELGEDAESIIDDAYKEWRDAELSEKQNLAEIADLIEVTDDDFINLQESIIDSANSWTNAEISDAERDNIVMNSLKAIAERKEKQYLAAKKIAEDLEAEGKWGSKAWHLAQEAMNNAKVESDGAWAEYSEYIDSITYRKVSLLDSDNDRLNTSIYYRNSLDTDEISEAFRHKQNLEDYNKILKNINEEYDIYETKWKEICEKGLENTEEGIEIYTKLTKLLKEKHDGENDILDEIIRHGDEIKQRSEDAISRSQTELALWEELYGDKASDEERDAKYLEHYNKAWAEKTKIATQAKQDYLAAIDEFGRSSEEAKDLYDVWREALIDEAKAKNAVTDYIKGAQERENQQLQELYDLTQSNADLQYRIWEKTAGRDAKNSEKNAKKLEILSQQLASQTASVVLATKLYNEAVAEYGEGSNEALSAYNDYLNESLELANLNSEILDIEEENAKRQEKARNAKSDYLEYMKKYEKYYLDHGMTLEELEKDARLVSGYDPNYKETATNAVTSIVDETNAAIKDLTSSTDYKTLVTNFSNIGTTFAEAVDTGAAGQTEAVITTVKTMIGECLYALEEKRPSWVTAGVESITSFIEGLQSMYQTTVERIASMMVGWVNRVFAMKPWWVTAGADMVDGFVQGIESRIEAAAEAAARMAAAALRAAKAELDINSPSKAFAEIGRYAVLGLTKGLVDNSDLAAEAATSMADATIENLKSTIAHIYDIVNSDIDSEPTIRPVIDLSNVKAGATRLNAMFSREQAMEISSNMAKHTSEEIQNGSDVSGGSPTYQFTQNNYSPRALSRAEIYRQTKNQFSLMKRTVKA